MNIAILGYGKMGREVEKISIDRGHTIIIKAHSQEKATTNQLEKADIAIEFSTPKDARDNIMQCFDCNLPVVSGTTGWLDEFENTKEYCLTNMKTFFYASNFSVGVNIFFEINRNLSQLMNNFENYNISLEEIHHIHKLDKPSGTALTIAQDIIKNVKRKKHWTLENNTLDPESLGIKSIREAEVPGTHLVNYNSEEDYIEIKHIAKSRKGFALGAVLAAEWVAGRTGFFEMKDMLKF